MSIDYLLYAMNLAGDFTSSLIFQVFNIFFVFDPKITQGHSLLNENHFKKKIEKSHIQEDKYHILICRM